MPSLRQTLRWRYLIFTIIALSFSVAFLTAIDRLLDHKRLHETNSGTNVWFTSQAELECFRLLESLHRYHIGDDTVSHDDLMQRFNIFWNRLPILITGNRSEQLRQIPGFETKVQNFTAIQEDSEALISALKPMDTANYQILVAKLQQIQKPLHDLALAAFQYNNDFFASERAKADTSFNVLLGSLGIAILCGAVGFVLFYQSIGRTQRHLEEARNAETNENWIREQLAVAIESVSEAFILCDAEDRIVLYNSKYKEFYEPETALLQVGMSFEALIRNITLSKNIDTPGKGITMPSDDLEDWIAQRMAAHRQPQGTFDAKLHSGRWVRINERKTKSGGIVSIHTDITELKQREQTLREYRTQLEEMVQQRTEELQKANQELSAQKAQFQALMDNAPVEIGLKDKEGRYLLINRQSEIGFGLTNEQCKGKFPQDIFPTTDSGRKLYAHDQAVLKTGKTRTIEVEGKEENEMNRTFLATTFPLFDEQGQISGLGAVGLEITERKRMERALKKLNEELEQRVRERTLELQAAQSQLLRRERLATLGQLTATVSHELRNPLGAMTPSIHILRKQTDPNDERAQRALTRLAASVTRCDRIIDELLDYTRIKALDQQPIVIDQWLQDILDEQPKPQGIAVHLNLALPGIILSADPGPLRRAFINIYDNACQAMVSETAPKLPFPGARLSVATRITAKRVEITIRDNGPGIAPDILSKVMEPLFSTKGFGVGLGLPTVEQIMKQHAGGLEIESEVGRGTCVTLWLPLSKILPDQSQDAEDQYAAVSAHQTFSR